MKIIIIGAGVGGVGAALSLSKAGHEVQVVEQAGELRTGGYGLVLWPNGTAILRGLGIDFDGLGHRLERLDIHDDDGVRVVRLDLEDIAEGFGAPNMVLTRSKLVERMSTMLPEGSLLFDSQVAGFRQEAHGVSVDLANGRILEGDLLIGADGHKSLVRKEMVNAEPAECTGWATWHGTTPLPIELARSNRVQTLSGEAGYCIMHPLGEGRLYWAFETPWQEGELVPPDTPAGRDGAEPSVVEGLRSRFGHWASPIPELLDAITDADVGLFPHTLHRVPKRWGAGPVTLLGDAAHAVPPRSGMGANQALEDVWVLSRVLSRGGDTTALVREYERIRRRRLRMLWMYSQLTARSGGKQPAAFRRNPEGVSMTGFQRWQIKKFSTYLNAKEAAGAPRGRVSV